MACIQLILLSKCVGHLKVPICYCRCACTSSMTNSALLFSDGIQHSAMGRRHSWRRSTPKEMGDRDQARIRRAYENRASCESATACLGATHALRGLAAPVRVLQAPTQSTTSAAGIGRAIK